MFARTHAQHFWKSHRDKLRSNPLRRWVLHRWAFCGLATLAGCVGTSYAAAKYAPFGEERFAGWTMETIVTWFPYALTSRFFGELANSEVVPRAVHQAAIKFYGGSEVDAGAFRTLGDFFIRELPSSERPLDAAAAVVAPCDGTVMSCIDVSELDRPYIVQVKGHYYPIDNFFRASLPPLERGLRRYTAVIQLRNHDPHRVYAPSDFDIANSTHIPGTLYPLSEACARWIPQLYLTNERVVMIGRRGGDVKVDDRFTPQDRRPSMAMALVGGFCEGRIKMDFDERIVTNLETQLMTSIRRTYKNCVLPKGTPVGHFEMGSAVVIIFDCAGDVTAQSGDRVTLGTRLA
jgi:phosphatidylserine decarboxylase